MGFLPRETLRGKMMDERFQEIEALIEKKPS